MFKSITKIVGFSVLLVPVSALAVPITVDFTITSTVAFGAGPGTTQYNGYALGTLGTGSFTIEDSIGEYANVEVGITPIDFSLNWAGVSFDESTARLAFLRFDETGGFDAWGFGTDGGSCARLNCVSSVGSADFIVAGYNGGATGPAVVHQTDVYGFMNGSVTWNVRPSSSVPEPATLGLLGFGLLGATFARRNRAA